MSHYGQGTGTSSNVDNTARTAIAAIEDDTFASAAMLPDGKTLEVTANDGTKKPIDVSVLADDDGQTYYIQRADSTSGVPSAGEIAAPVNGDAALIRLNSGSVERYKHNGSTWALAITEPAPSTVQVDDALSDTSQNPVENQVIDAKFKDKLATANLSGATTNEPKTADVDFIDEYGTDRARRDATYTGVGGLEAFVAAFRAGDILPHREYTVRSGFQFKKNGTTFRQTDKSGMSFDVMWEPSKPVTLGEIKIIQRAGDNRLLFQMFESTSARTTNAELDTDEYTNWSVVSEFFGMELPSGGLVTIPNTPRHIGPFLVKDGAWNDVSSASAITRLAWLPRVATVLESNGGGAFTPLSSHVPNTAFPYSWEPNEIVSVRRVGLTRIEIIRTIDPNRADNLDVGNIATSAEVDLSTDPTKLVNVVEYKRVADTKQDTLPIAANKYVKRNAANTAWEAVDLPISPQNLIAIVGTPQAGDGEDGFYAIQTDAAKGTNDIWGPKTAGAWPAQADAKSADPDEGTLATLNLGAETAPKSYSDKTIADYVAGKIPRNFASYGEANAAGAQPRDTIFIIGMKKEAWARTETTGNFAFPGTGSIEDPNWFRIGDGDVVRFPANGGAQLNGFENFYWSDETVGAQPTPELGNEFATAVSSAASTDTEAVKDVATVTLTHYRWVDNGGAAPVAIVTNGPAGDGLRGAPVVDTAALSALSAKDGETRRAGDFWYVFTLGATSGDLADGAATGFWSKVFRIYTTLAASEIGTLKKVPNVKEDGTAKANDDYVVEEGLLPLVNGYRLTDGATDNPKFALMFPTFVNGNDLLVPSSFDGSFVRNLGGNAAAFMAAQNDGTAVNGLRTLRTYVQSDWNGQSNNDFGKGSGSLTGAANNSTGLGSSDPETRPFNFAMQFCLVLDSYPSVKLTNAASVPAGIYRIRKNADGSFELIT